MDTFNPPLTVYCSKGRVTNLRFRSLGSNIQDHVREALKILGVTEELQEMVSGKLDGADFAPGFKFERGDSTIGPGNLDSQEPDNPDAKCVVVYIRYYHAQLEGYLEETVGKLQEFNEVMNGSESSDD